MLTKIDMYGENIIPKTGGTSRYYRNVGIYLPICTLSHPRRQ